MTAGKHGRGTVGVLPPCPSCGAPWHDRRMATCATIGRQPTTCTCGDPTPDPRMAGGCGRCQRPVYEQIR